MALFGAACTSPGLAAGGPRAGGAGGAALPRRLRGAPGCGGFVRDGSCGVCLSLLGRGDQAPATEIPDQAPATEIPWDQVRGNWFLALWRSSTIADAPVSLFLVNAAVSDSSVVSR